MMQKKLKIKQNKTVNLPEYNIIIKGDSFPGFVFISTIAIMSIFVWYPEACISYSQCQCFSSHIILILLEIKLPKAEESDSKISNLYQ